MKFFSRVFCVIVPVLLLFCLCVPVYADAWIPPSDAYYNDDVYNLLAEPAGRQSMNYFLSNYSEANLATGDIKDMSDKAVLTFLFKHFELNASLYPGVSITNNGNSHKVMTVSKSTVEKAAERMFNRSWSKHPVADFKGYSSGFYHVTADNAGKPLKILSIANHIEYFGNNQYTVFFSIYKTESINESLYSLLESDIYDKAAFVKIGSGEAEFNYIGGKGLTAFKLLRYTLDELEKSELVYTQANEPVTDSITGPPPVTSSTTVTDTTTTDAAISDGSTSRDETAASGKAVIGETVDQKPSVRLVYITVVVILAAVAATAVILLVYKKKK